MNVFLQTNSKMHGQKQSSRSHCCCGSLRTGCILVGVLQILVIPVQSVFFLNMVPFPAIHLLYTGIAVAVTAAAPVIYGAIRQNRFFLWPSVVFNILSVFAVPLIYCGIEIRNTRDPLGNASIWIYTALLILITATQALLTLVLCRYISELREQDECKHKYNRVGARSEANKFFSRVV